MKRNFILEFALIFLFIISFVHSSVSDFGNGLADTNFGEAFVNDLIEPSEQIDGYDGYIVELKEQPIVKKKIELDNEKKTAKEKSETYLEKSETGFYLLNFYERWRGANLAKKYAELKENAPKEINELSNRIVEEHEIALAEIENILGRKVEFIKNEGDPENSEGSEFIFGFNGFVLDITEREVEIIKQAKSVKNVYPNYKVHTLLDESIPAMSIDLFRNYFGLTGKGVTIAVIDTGIDAEHESLDDLDDNPETNDPKIIGWKDYINFKPEPYDDHGHGTHVSGIAAGTGGATRYIGVAPKANLVGVKVLSGWGSGTFSGVIAGIEWTIQNKDVYNISVISMSLGANVNSDGTTPVEIAADYAVASGINFVVAAGNSGPNKNTVGIPASAKDVITVGAVDKNLELAYFSSRGPTKDGRLKPEVSAVGVSVMSSIPNNEYESHSGTSMATPMVSGFVALLLEKNSSLNTRDVKNLLMKTALDKGEKGPDNDYGYGVINGLKTLIELSPLEHEISLNVDFSIYLAVNESEVFKATLENLGINNENVEVVFLVNENEIERKSIPISKGEKKEVSFNYIADNEGEYEIKIKAEPVDDEAFIENNEVKKIISALKIKGKIKAVVLESWGTKKNKYTIFDYLNNYWMRYGDYAVEIDYKSLDKEDISYENIVSSNADVLIISHAWTSQHYGLQNEYTDNEIEAIKKYVKEGHGLIATAGTISEYSKNNAKLGELFGIKEKEGLWNSWDSYYSDSINILARDGILTKNIPDSYFGVRWAVINLELDNEKPVIVGKALSKNDLWKNIFISAYKPELGASIYFTNFLEYRRAGEQDKQFFYNAIVWAKQNTGQLENDISLSSLQTPKKVLLNESFNISAKIKNNGNQQTVDVELTIDEVKRELKKLTLSSSEEKIINFNYVFNELGSHTISIEAITEADSFKINNKLTGRTIVPQILITEINDYGLDTNGNGLYDYIVLDIGAEVFDNGEYEIEFDVESFLGAKFESIETSNTIATEDNNITIKIPVKNIKKYELNGPYKIKNFVLYFENETIDEKEEFHITKPYKVSELEISSKLTRKFRDYGLDLDNNGLYEKLVIDVGVDIKADGEYTIDGFLRKEWDYIALKSLVINLSRGIQNISLEFNGEDIRESGYNGPYDLRKLYLISNREILDRLSYSEIYTTSEYNFTDFETRECFDFDDGIDISVASYVKEERERYEDKCVDDKTLKEYYCKFNIWEAKKVLEESIVKCKILCFEGVCVNQSQINRECADSEPVNNLKVKGEVKYRNEIYEDKCEEAGKSVREYFCVNDKLRNFVKRCSEEGRCESGICVVPANNSGD